MFAVMGTPVTWSAAEGAVGAGAPADWLPADWVPIPDELLEELGPLPADADDPAGPDDPDDADHPADARTGTARAAGLDDLMAGAATAAPSAATLAVLGSVIGCVPLSGLSDAAQEQALLALARLDRHVDAIRLTAIAGIAGPEGSCDNAFGLDFSPNLVSAAMNLSLPAADRVISLSRRLTALLTRTLAMMRDGRLSLTQASALHEATVGLPDDVALRIEAKVLTRAGYQDLTGFRRALRRALATCDPGWTARSREARRETWVSHDPRDDGTAYLTVHAPAEVTAIVHAAMTAYAERSKAMLGGNRDARMVAGLRSWAESYLSSPDAPRHHGQPVHLDLVVDLPSLLGLRDHPAELVGVGPVPAEVSRLLAVEGAPLRRLVTDPYDGRLLDYGRTTYAAPQPLADLLVAACRHSMGPHSNVPAAGCDLDHNQPWGDGGTTDVPNLTPLDRRWHRAKTFGGWSYVKRPDGTVTWSSPAGAVTCQVDPQDYRLGP